MLINGDGSSGIYAVQLARQQGPRGMTDPARGRVDSDWLSHVLARAQLAWHPRPTATGCRGPSWWP